MPGPFPAPRGRVPQSTSVERTARSYGMMSFRWIILGLLFCASIINYIDRQSLSILARTIQDELNISDIGYSNVVQLFLFAYMLSFLVSGWVTDRLGIRASMALFISWWSIANILTGFV